MNHKPTLEEKYNWICSQLEITDPDVWEGDALLKLKNTCPDDECRSLYLGLQLQQGTFSFAVPDTIDQAIEQAMRSASFK